MQMTHNEAIAHLIRTGDASGAFTIALRDEGIRADITLAEWLPFAEACIARRAAEEAAYA